ncbi:hypothetical protein E2562_035536 [Oryza meyeriana var. granulata]|uniref:non-specific serine/threonine protein kinase n=1 Tax=Oryza meyeriana var. granulata TaxID=110450 RepID=A0A6G1E991_9ORYZ|nr:hypothetical protein E2562_035536 [Oryza meyeriana var. granulata]
MATGSHLRAEDHDKIFLLSPDTTFSCGFYHLGTNAFTFSIWYTNTTEKTVVWTANPYSPANGYSPVNLYGSRVSLGHDGNLVLADTNGTTVWESKTSSGKHTTVTLLDSGNLVIKDSSNNTVWQSFHSPTDTLLPWQNLTKDIRLVSRYHHLYFDNDNVLRLLYDGPEITSIYWPSPDYKAEENGRSRFNSTRIAFLNDKGNFVSSDGFKIEATDSGPGIKRRITIDYDGNFRMYSLNESTGNWTVTGQAVIQMCYVHGLCGKNGICDYSGENILLTRDYDAKVADFGLAKLAKRDSTSFNFTHMRGTMGYMAPEWAMNLPINAKVDVYSYGVVLLEIVTGIRVSSGIVVDERQVEFPEFVQEAKKMLATGNVTDLVDDRLHGHFDPEQAMTMVKVAVLCLEERSKRPTMDEILKALLLCDDEDDYHPAYSY